MGVEDLRRDGAGNEGRPGAPDRLAGSGSSDAATAAAAVTAPRGLAGAPAAAGDRRLGAGVRRAPYLKYLKVASFGALSNRVVGPFSPGLNVVFGRNEAGKTTLASFIGGVLFGWEEARGSRNTYKPQNTERVGALIFGQPAGEGAPALGADGAAQADAAGRGAAAGAFPGASDDLAAPDLVVSRARNADGLQGDVSVAADIDRDTFRTMFSLTSDELRSLRNTPDVTAKLLTAGSGTGASPAHALAAVQERLAACTSRAASAEGSIVRLTTERNELRAQLREAADRMDAYRKQDAELHQLEDQRRAMAERLAATNAALEGLSACRAGTEGLEAEARALEAEGERLREEERQAVDDRRDLERGVGRRLARLSNAEDRALRDRLDALAAKEERQAHAVDRARGNFAASKAAYEVMQESGDDQAERAHEAATRRMRLALAALLPVVMLAGGLPLFAFGRSRGSLTYMSLGLVLVAFALLMAAAAFVMLVRPDRGDDARKERLRDAQWVMRQDEKKLASCLADEEALASAIGDELAEAGLAEAQGSLRRARALLDEAKDVRSDMALCQQRQQAAAARLAEAERRLGEIAVQRDQLYERAAVEPGESLAAIDEAISRRSLQRDGLLEASEQLNRRHGELKQLLAHASAETSFDELKIRYQSVRTRLNEAVADFERLLLAERMLQAAIATWESKSQPEVYRQASRLLALMTDGRWTSVSLSAEGVLQVTDRALTTLEPVHLSLGTCQQLYLAMRMALLLTADNVGRAIPILADDILVHFDAERRRGAARALAELAATRQVILFTCHEEVAAALLEAAPGATRIDL